MDRRLNTDAIRDALDARGWSQKDLAAAVGVSQQAVTNWFKGGDMPRPATLLKLATKLSLKLEQVISSEIQAQKPIIAFRKKGNAKTTDQHILKATAMGSLLKALVPYLPPLQSLRTQIPAPSTDYEQIQANVAETRQKLGIGQEAVFDYSSIIKEFKRNAAVIVPVMWGQKSQHENAIHIYLPEERATFIYLNLDTHIEDFKFWMAHELAHVYTQALAGTIEGEDFSDRFAGALLFTKECARNCYRDASQARSKHGEIEVLKRYAQEHDISIFSVFCEVRNYIKHTNSSPLRVQEAEIHPLRNSMRGELVSEILFRPTPPDANMYIAASREVFGTDFFDALGKMIAECETGPGYIQQMLNISLKDAVALRTELMR